MPGSSSTREEPSVAGSGEVHVALILGTSGEAVKMKPVLQELLGAGVSPSILCTYQQGRQTLSDLDSHTDGKSLFPSVRIHDVSGRSEKEPLRTFREIPWWAFRSVLGLRKCLRSHRFDHVLVHGDTLTTLLGALVARFSGIRFGHVEAGMRSGFLLRPFPEEISRRVTDRLADTLFVPGHSYLQNVSGAWHWANRNGHIVDTGLNTVVDTLSDAIQTPPRLVDLAGSEIHWTSFQKDDYLLVSMHRTEFYKSFDAVQSLFDLLIEHLNVRKVIFIAHDAAWNFIRHHANVEQFTSQGGFVVGKLPHDQFLYLVARSHGVLTDSGGLQQECASIGRACVVHRRSTEAKEGLGRWIQLTGGDINAIPERLKSAKTNEPPNLERDFPSPSRLVVDFLLRPQE